YDGCSSEDTIVLYVFPPPTITASGGKATLGQSASICASGGDVYTWSTNQTGNCIIVSPTASTNYFVTGTDKYGCSNIANAFVFISTSLNVTPNPSNSNITVEIPQEIAENEIEIYNSLGEKMYAERVIANRVVINICKFSSGVYFVKVANKNGTEVAKFLKVN
ncbi:MAG: T9SS type A sorting domain-containing protein, partial [Bacteroidales bacterium]|nr:T9SS type A sorting domain-containing protein [Bacteroidales bacterium]